MNFSNDQINMLIQGLECLEQHPKELEVFFGADMIVHNHRDRQLEEIKELKTTLQGVMENRQRAMKKQENSG